MARGGRRPGAGAKKRVPGEVKVLSLIALSPKRKRKIYRESVARMEELAKGVIVVKPDWIEEMQGAVNEITKQQRQRLEDLRVEAAALGHSLVRFGTKFYQKPPDQNANKFLMDHTGGSSGSSAGGSDMQLIIYLPEKAKLIVPEIPEVVKN